MIVGVFQYMEAWIIVVTFVLKFIKGGGMDGRLQTEG